MLRCSCVSTCYAVRWRFRQHPGSGPRSGIYFMSASAPNGAARPELDHLAGLVERVTFHNADSGFCVLRLKVKGERELITLVGHTPTVAPGEYASASGTW